MNPLEALEMINRVIRNVTMVATPQGPMGLTADDRDNLNRAMGAIHAALQPQQGSAEDKPADIKPTTIPFKGKKDTANGK